MTRRISRGTPAMLTTDEQTAYVNMIDGNPQLRESIETLLGRKLDAMTFGQKLLAVHSFLEQGHANAAFAQAARAARDIQRLAQETRGEVSLADRVQLLEAQLQNKDEQIAQLQAERDERDGYISELTNQLTALKATPAMAEHSRD